MGSVDNICRILQLSDCTMMYILSYLDATSLFNLSRTCLYFKNIVKEPKLWRYVDARNEPNTTKKVEYVCERIHDKTSHLFLKADSKYDGHLRQDCLLSWKFWESLVVLSLENQRFNGKSLFLYEFPKTLEELSLKKTVVKNGKLFFHGSFDRMANLRVLIVDECNWIDSSFLMSVGNYDKLEILSIVNCQTLHFDAMPYLSFAKHGFKQLKIIDTRFNTISNEIVKSFSSHQSLLAIYCQSMRSYQLDEWKPLIRDGYSFLGNENKQLLIESIIKNETLEQYMQAVGGSTQELPKSVLYEDPYSQCKCGYKELIDEDQSPLNEPNEIEDEFLYMVEDDYINFQRTQKLFCQKHLGELSSFPISSISRLPQNSSTIESSDSESDDNGNCCMLGGEHRGQIIVLKVRERDERGNMPQAELINLFDFPTIRFGSRSRNAPRSEEKESSGASDPQPSTSGQAGTSGLNLKRKAKDSPENNVKRLKSEESTDNIPDLSKPSTSRADVEGVRRNEGDSPNRDLYVLDSDGESSEDDSGIENGNRQNEVRNERPARVSFSHQILPRHSIHVDIFDENLTIRVANDRIHISAMPRKNLNLRRLSLRGYRNISDVALDLIKNLNLDMLDVTYTSVTKEGIEKFLVFNPNCRVIHKDFCICKPKIPC